MGAGQGGSGGRYDWGGGGARLFTGACNHISGRDFLPLCTRRGIDSCLTMPYAQPETFGVRQAPSRVEDARKGSGEVMGPREWAWLAKIRKGGEREERGMGQEIIHTLYAFPQIAVRPSPQLLSPPPTPLMPLRHINTKRFNLLWGTCICRTKLPSPQLPLPDAQY